MGRGYLVAGIFLGVGCIMLASPGWAVDVVVPASLANVEGGSIDSSPLGADGEVRFQQVYSASTLNIAPGSLIVGVTFRVDGGENDGVPPQTVTNYEIRLSRSVNPAGSLSAMFADNRGADEVVVRSGPLTIDAATFPAGAGPGPEPFGPFIPFTTPYRYTGGDLLLEIAYSGFATGRSCDDSDFGAQGEELFGPSGAGGFSATMGIIREAQIFVTRFDVVAPNAAPAMSMVGLGVLTLGLIAVGALSRQLKRM